MWLGNSFAYISIKISYLWGNRFGFRAVPVPEQLKRAKLLRHGLWFLQDNTGPFPNSTASAYNTLFRGQDSCKKRPIPRCWTAQIAIRRYFETKIPIPLWMIQHSESALCYFYANHTRLTDHVMPERIVICPFLLHLFVHQSIENTIL